MFSPTFPHKHLLLPQRSPCIRRRHNLHNYVSPASTRGSHNVCSSVGAPLPDTPTVGTYIITFLTFTPKLLQKQPLTMWESERNKQTNKQKNKQTNKQTYVADFIVEKLWQIGQDAHIWNTRCTCKQDEGKCLLFVSVWLHTSDLFNRYCSDRF